MHEEKPRRNEAETPRASQAGTASEVHRPTDRPTDRRRVPSTQKSNILFSRRLKTKVFLAPFWLLKRMEKTRKAEVGFPLMHPVLQARKRGGRADGYE